jgi:hypothetical protein
MEKDTNQYRAEKKRQEQKLEALLLGRLQNDTVTEFDINKVKAGLEAIKQRGIEPLKKQG